ncbi:MAG: 30S ribosomal protein S2 [Proteobacteria bacterium]|nr:MAG: 30S ribosomal protein S2 [Pseudomonadota bacterium]
MSNVSMRDMLEAGVHFGHQVHRWNPKMRPYIWGARNGIHIINLQRTVRMFRQALDFASTLGQRGDKLLYVGTKRQAQEIIETEAQRARQPYVAHRWLGGMLTNFRTIRTSIDRIDTIEKQLDVGNVERLVKKEVNRLERERDKLMRNLGGIRDLKKLPGAVLVIDTVKEHLAVAEARKLKIPIIALVDSNSDPKLVDFPIPSNDDAIRAIKLFTTALTDAYLAGAAAHKDSFQAEFAPSANRGVNVDVVVRGDKADAAPAAPAAPGPRG